jgi:hypothetical protein
MCSYHDNTWLVKSKLNLEDYNLANKNGQQHNTAYILGNKCELSISDTKAQACMNKLEIYSRVKRETFKQLRFSCYS